ncbi:GNAT family N-acetyltransferase [Spirosoma sp. RP8]|uniref:GNAT family N-acetyltransferase n=1 Tax=Spirosoma liriopis TaxID=2937440 RepID=A0ABT0HF31_9BACT|nr:GNAT family N-acetyltransferase [Spirosoma liriopis]MCK8490268.1 GNAT family N-acetyltransferase [Spirosoma liriopis]
MDHALNTLVRRNFIAKAAYFAQHLPGTNVVDTNAYTIVDCGLPSDTFNVIVPKTTDLIALTDLFENGVSEFTRKRFPMSLWCWEELYTAELAILIHHYELTGDETNVAMWLNLRTRSIKQPCPSDLLIRPVQAPADYDQFAYVLADLFGDSPEADQIRLHYQQVSQLHLPDQPIQLYIGEYNGQVVATGTLFVTDESAGIYDIATRPAWRKRGFGSRMFERLLWEANQQSASQVVLQASADGLTIYKHAGFSEVGTVQVWGNQHSIIG